MALLTLAHRTKQGVWIAGTGAAMQLVGLSWDAVLHKLDPTLAEREGVFSITNPSHLMIISGLGLTVLGIIWGLSAGFGGSDSRAALLTRASTAALVFLLAGAGTVALATGGITGQPGHSHGGVTAGIGGGHVHSVNLPFDDPVFVSLVSTLRDKGTLAALDQLNTQAKADTNIQSQAHNYAHSLGRYSFTYYGDASQAFTNCRDDWQSGCYHGVLEAYFLSQPSVGQAQVANVCNGQIKADAKLILKFQCVHGLGHGLMMYLDHNLPKSLTYCDYQAADWDRQSCYGGVFMENIIFAQSLLTPAGKAASGGHKAYVKSNDAQYPCNSVGTVYKDQCYLMQTSVMLTFNGYDFGKAASTCGQAPAAYVTTCFKSLGRDIAGFTLQDPSRSLDLCQKGPTDHRSDCYVGVAKNFIDVTWTTDNALTFCSKVPVDGKNACYQAIGEQIAGIFPDTAQRTAQCARVEQDYVSVCTSAAGGT